jgi:hypothetical protein
MLSGPVRAWPFSDRIECKETNSRMKWITRENANVDRIACPWLIRRFIDKDAVFLFAPKEQVMSAAKREGATPYDVPGVELGHVDGRCSFESIMLKYRLMGDPALVEMAKIVHAADVSVDIGTSESNSTRVRYSFRTG